MDIVSAPEGSLGSALTVTWNWRPPGQDFDQLSNRERRHDGVFIAEFGVKSGCNPDVLKLLATSLLLRGITRLAWRSLRLLVVHCGETAELAELQAVIANVPLPEGM